jgi:hypothetical protein
MIGNDELENICEETVTANFMEIIKHLTEGTKKHNKIHNRANRLSAKN